MSDTEPLARPPEHEPFPGWDQTLTGGAGVALLHIVHAHAGIGDWPTAHQWAKAITRGGISVHVGASLFHGAPAVAFVLRVARQPSYAQAVARLDGHIAEHTQRRLDQAHARLDAGRPPALHEFDLINGLTGLGAYHLSAGHLPRTRDVLSYLVRLTEPLTLDGHPVPGWWTPDGPSGRPDRQWPGGHANLGIAHGISGPLALLATAMLHGVTVSGQADAIDRIERFFDRWRCGTPQRPWWPGMISRSEWADGTTRQAGPQRPSWCYGTPGVARARQLAALATNDTTRQDNAEMALAACVSDEDQLVQLGDDSLCHGWAGLIHTVRRATADARDTVLAEALRRVTSRWQHPPPSRPDHDGMLEGTAGVALVRAAVPAGIAWDACLLTATSTTNIHMEGTG